MAYTTVACKRDVPTSLSSIYNLNGIDNNNNNYTVQKESTNIRLVTENNRKQRVY